jgi:hypothetical protein
VKIRRALRSDRITSCMVGEIITAGCHSLPDVMTVQSDIMRDRLGHTVEQPSHGGGFDASPMKRPGSFNRRQVRTRPPAGKTCLSQSHRSLRKPSRCALNSRPIAKSRRSAWQSGFAERLIGSIRRNFLDHIIVCGEAASAPYRALMRVISEDGRYQDSAAVLSSRRPCSGTPRRYPGSR